MEGERGGGVEEEREEGRIPYGGLKRTLIRVHVCENAPGYFGG